MEMYFPAHPGEIIREDCIKALGLSVTATAKGLGVSRQSLSELLNGRTGVSAEMAIRLERTGWGTADAWLRMQAHHDLWQARQHADKIVGTRFSEPVLAWPPPRAGLCRRVGFAWPNLRTNLRRDTVVVTQARHRKHAGHLRA